MKNSRIVLFYGGMAAAAAFVVATSLLLMPERVGSHFRHGVARDFMSLHAYVAMMVALLVLIPLFMEFWAYTLMRKYPQLVNIPNSEYWLAPARRDATCTWMRGQNRLLGLGVMACLGAGHYTTLEANVASVPKVPGVLFVCAAAVLAVGFVCWVVTVRTHFNSIQKDVHAPH